MLEGLLVDLVPYGERFTAREPVWRNNDSWYWATVGERHVIPKAALKRRQQARAEWAAEHNASEVMFGIQTKDGTPIGEMSMNWVVPYHRLAALGASIGEPEYWGGGYGTDALLLIVDYAFDWLDMHKLWLFTFSQNVRVMRQMEKVGFALEARLRESAWVDGVWHDQLAYGLLRDDWPGREAMIARLGLRARKDNG